MSYLFFVLAIAFTALVFIGLPYLLISDYLLRKRETPVFNALVARVAEHIYRIANFAPEDRAAPLTEMDKPGLAEVQEALRLYTLEVDRDTRHACAEALGETFDAFYADGARPSELPDLYSRAHSAVMNTRSI